MHWVNSISIVLPTEEKLLPLVLHVFSHEVSHAWLGLKIRPSSFEKKELSWFLEGFNDYLALTLALQSGFINESQYFKVMNKYLNLYTLSPLKALSIKDFESIEYHSMDYFSIETIKGHLLAKKLVENAQGIGFKAFSEALKELVINSKDERLNTKMIENAFSQFFTQETLQTFIQKHSSNIDFPQTDNIATLRPKKVLSPHLDFDTTELYYENRISEVATGSNAYKAGLRNGQKVVSFHIPFLSPNPKFEFIIEEKENVIQKKIAYFPKMSKVTIQQYELKSRNE